MLDQKKLIVSHAPFWHNGSRITNRSYHTMLAALPAVLAGLYYYGIPVFGVVCLSVATAMLWELAINLVTKQPVTIGDGNAALIGLLLAMLLPATMPWWAVITGTFIAVVIGKQIFGGIGSNAFNPVALAVAIMMISWKDLFNFDGMLLNYDFDFAAIYPLALAKHFGSASLESLRMGDLLYGQTDRRSGRHLWAGSHRGRNLFDVKRIYPLGDITYLSGRVCTQPPYCST